MKRSFEHVLYNAGLVLIGGLLLATCAPRTETRPEPIDPAGRWEGEMYTDEVNLPLTVTLAYGPEGWTGTVDVPARYARDYPLVNLRVDSTTLTFQFPDLLPPAAFEGAIGHRLRGKFMSLSGLDTLYGAFDLGRRLPEIVPYSSQSVRFRNGDVELAGSLFLPRTSGPHPAVVLVHGSGPQTRDSYLRWFADQFARAGFVALLYDKRGTGESGGERWPQTTGSFADLADDALAGVRFLSTHAFVDSSRIGIWGLSQGAWIGPLAAVRAHGLVRFLIMISGGGVSPAEQELYDDEIRLHDLGFERTEIDTALAYLRLADQFIRTGSDADWQRFAVVRDQVREQPWYPHLDRFPQILPREAPVWAGLRVDLDYDPAPILAAAKIPMLLILGEADRLTPSRETALRVERALASSGSGKLTIHFLPGADHALLVKSTPQASWLEERPAPGWVEYVIKWAGRQ